MNKYRKLLTNTLLFGIGTFSSKVLVFLLTPLYTYALDPGQFGIVDLVQQLSNVLIPLVSVGILNSIIRFGLDSTYRKSDVFTTGLLTLLCGFGIFLLCMPLFRLSKTTDGYVSLIYLYVLMSTMRSLCSQFVRAKGYVRLYAVDGVFSTLMTILFNLLYLLVFQWEIRGYLFATISADFSSALLLFWIARLWKFIQIRRGMGRTAKAMLKYALPLIPTNISWWVLNFSNRYVVKYYKGEVSNGLYALAYKMPMAVTMISNIFVDAWQMSAIADVSNPRERASFFTRVFGALQSVMFLGASGIILFAKVAIKVLSITNEDYYIAWKFVPLLVVATVFSCLSTFLGSVYMVEKRSVLSLMTTLAGAAVNLGLSFLWVEQYDVNGAAMAMFCGYFLMFALRLVSACRMVKMRVNFAKLFINTVIVFAQSVILIYEVQYWILWEMALTSLVIALNLKPVLVQMKKMLLNRK